MFEIFYFLSGSSCFLTVVTMLASDLLFYGLTLYICGLYDELIYELKAIADYDPSTAALRIEKIRKCVQFHVDILE